MCAMGILLALMERSQSNKGQVVNTDMVISTATRIWQVSDTDLVFGTARFPDCATSLASP